MISRLMLAYSHLPRAGKWLVWATLAIGGLLFVDRVLLNFYDRWSSRASTLQTQLSRLRSLADSDSDDGKIIEIGMSNFGQPTLPADYTKAAAALTQRVNAIFDFADILDRTQTEKSSSLQIPADLRSSAGLPERFDRVIIEITFEAEPEAVARILSDLESSSAVSAVSKVRIDKGTSSTRFSDRDRPATRVRATIAVEAWAKPESARVSSGGRD